MDSGDGDPLQVGSQSEESGQDSVGSSEASQRIELFVQEMVPKLASGIAKMEVLRPEILRVTPVHRALEHGALAFRAEGDYYFKSMKSEKISIFWSHSWHGGHWKKILTLATLYNGPPSLAFGMFLSLVMMLLFGLGHLPGAWQSSPDFPGYASWSLGSAFVGTCFIMLFWRPQTRVFFDRICINEDSDEKTLACLSLAGLLRRSDSLLILWDPTWTERMWCVFELAAFLKSKENQEKVIVIRPVLLGPISIAIFVMGTAAMLPVTTVLPADHAGPSALPTSFGTIAACSVVFACLAVRTLRKYFRALDLMKQQSQAISMENLRASCCEMNHVCQGQRIMCDRAVLKECVNLWFGSEANFEETVRSEILKIVGHDLEERVFTTRWILAVNLPVFWSCMDLAAGEMQRSYPSLWDHGAPSWLLFGLGCWLTLPLVFHVLILICRLTRRPSKCEMLTDLGVALVGLVLPIFVAATSLIFSLLLPVPLNRLGRTAVGLGCLVLYSLCNRCLCACLRRRLESE